MKPCKLITLFCFCLLCLAPLRAGAAKVHAQLRTVAGELKVIQLDELTLGCRFVIMLGERKVLSTDCEQELGVFSSYQVPSIIKHIKANVAPFDEAVLFQQNMWGNACSGGPFWLLGIKKDGSFQRSDLIDYCSGPDPVITEGQNKIFIKLPGKLIDDGPDHLPDEFWVYEGGKVRQLKTKP